MVPVHLTGTATPSGASMGAIPWATILALLAEYGSKVLPVILADIAAKKSLAQIIADCIAALAGTGNPRSAIKKGECLCCES
jgi:hypothetical protein